MNKICAVADGDWYARGHEVKNRPVGGGVKIRNALSFKVIKRNDHASK